MVLADLQFQNDPSMNTRLLVCAAIPRIPAPWNNFFPSTSRIIVTSRPLPEIPELARYRGEIAEHDTVHCVTPVHSRQSAIYVHYTPPRERNPETDRTFHCELLETLGLLLWNRSPVTFHRLIHETAERIFGQRSRNGVRLMFFRSFAQHVLDRKRFEVEDPQNSRFMNEVTRLVTHIMTIQPAQAA